MTHSDHVRLIQNGIPIPAGVWADMGSGEGAFTLALADIGGSEIELYSIDKEAHKLVIQEHLFERNFPDTHITYRHEDFTRQLELPQLDGVLMANSLHFIQRKKPLLELMKTYLKPGGKFILVEYNVDTGNLWVPYPVSFNNWKKIAVDAGFCTPRLLDTEPSHFLEEIYSSVCEK